MKLTGREIRGLTKDFKTRLRQTAQAETPHTTVVGLGADSDGKPKLAAFLVYAGYAGDEGFSWLRDLARKYAGPEEEDAQP